jgi:hypothetical protein
VECDRPAGGNREGDIPKTREKKSELVKTEENFTILINCGRLPFCSKTFSADVSYTNLL